MTVCGCVQIPNLAIAVARRDEPALADRPLVLTVPHSTRPTVYAAAPEVGVAPGAPLRQALLRCPAAACRPAEPARDREVYQALAALLGRFSPRVAAPAPLPDGMVELDLGRRTRGQALALAQQLGQVVRAELLLAPAIGLGTTRFVAQRAAARAGAGATVAVPTGCEPAFLADQPIAVLPLDAETLRRLDLLGLRTLGAVAALPLDALQVQFGAIGARLYRLARGLDDTPIARTLDAPAIARRRRFAGALHDRGLLEQAITTLAARLAADLAAGGWSTRAVMLTLELEDGAPWSAQRTLVEATTDAAALTPALLALSRRAALDCGVEALTVAATELAPLAVGQLELFAPEQGTAERLRDVLGRLGARSAGCLLRARVADPAARLPERRARLEPREPA